MFRVEAVVGKAGLWHWVCPCGAKDLRWYRHPEEAITAGSDHDCRVCCDEQLERLLEAR
jgi:hypothetical protein